MLLEVVCVVGGGVCCWRWCVFLEVMCVVGGDVCCWR